MSTTVDSRGTRCPTPIIDLARAARDLGTGAVIDLLATDPAAEADVPAWCRMRGHTLIEVQDAGVQDAGGPDSAGRHGARVRRYTVRLN